MKISADARAMGQAAIQEKARVRAADLEPVIIDLRGHGVTTLRGMARALTERGIPTARGKGEWTPMQVARVLERIEA